MSDLIDHAAEARTLLARAGQDTSSNWPLTTGEYKADMIAAAQVHATLELAEQQRAANMIAMLANGSRMVAEGIGNPADYLQLYADLNPRIREVLAR